MSCSVCPEGVDFELDVGATLEHFVRNLTCFIGQELILVVVIGKRDAVLRQEGLCLVNKGNKLTELESVGKIGPRNDDILVADDLVIENGIHNAVGGKLLPTRVGTADTKTGFAQHSANLGSRVAKKARKLNKAVAKVCNLLHCTLQTLLGDVSNTV